MIRTERLPTEEYYREVYSRDWGSTPGVGGLKLIRINGGLPG